MFVSKIIVEKFDFKIIVTEKESIKKEKDTEEPVKVEPPNKKVVMKSNSQRLN